MGIVVEYTAQGLYIITNVRCFMSKNIDATKDVILTLGGVSSKLTKFEEDWGGVDL